MLHSSKTHLLTLYFLDSGSYSNGYWDFFGFFMPTAYDWIREVGRLICGWHQVLISASRLYRVKSIGFCRNPVRMTLSKTLLCAKDSPASINQIERPFTPDSGKDLGTIWAKRQGQLVPNIKKTCETKRPHVFPHSSVREYPFLPSFVDN
jgi:hypothetical protein